MGCVHSRKKKSNFKSGDGKDKTVGEGKKEYNEKRDDLDDYSKQNGFESQRNLLVDKTEKLVFRKRSWRYADNKNKSDNICILTHHNKRVHEGYPNFLNPFEIKEEETVSIEEENVENNAEDKNILEYPVELNPFPTSDDEDSYEDDDISEENNENNLEEPNDTENPILMNPSENLVEDYNEDENPLKEENLENGFSILEENVGIIIDNIEDDKNHGIVGASSFSDNSKNMIIINSLPPLSNEMSNALPADIKDKNVKRPAPLPPLLNSPATEDKTTSNPTLMNPFENLVEDYNEDENPLKEENLENDSSILEENVANTTDNNEDDKNHDIVGASPSSGNSKSMITINSLPPLFNKMSNALPADIKGKNVKRPAPLPPSLNLLATENKITSNRVLDKTISSEVEKVTERKISRKAPSPPRRFAPLPQSVCLTEHLQSRLKVCDFNNATISNAEFPQGYRNLRPAPPPPVSFNCNMDKTLQSKAIPDNVYERKPRRKSILDLFKVKKKKKSKKN